MCRIIRIVYDAIKGKDTWLHKATEMDREERLTRQSKVKGNSRRKPNCLEENKYENLHLKIVM